MKPRMYEFRVRGLKSGNSFCFLGQGQTVQAAFAEGLANAQDSFRPKQDGRQRQENKIAVFSGEGLAVQSITLQEFTNNENK